MGGVSQQNFVELLFNIYKDKGFVSTDTVFEVLNSADMSLDAVDRICDELLSMGVIIRDDPADFSNDDDSEYDRGKADYEQLYYEVLLLEPELKLLINALRQIQPPQHREWKTLMPQAQAGNAFAQNRLCEMYLRTVLNLSYSIATRYNLSIADTFQEGTIGLLTAIEKFNPLDQDVFPSYFPLWVRQCIFRGIPFSPKPDAYFPAHIRSTLYSIFELVKNHYCELCDTATYCPNLVQSITETLECTPELATQYLDYFTPTESVEQISEETPETVSDEGIFSLHYDEQLDTNALYYLIRKEFTVGSVPSAWLFVDIQAILPAKRIIDAAHLLQILSGGLPLVPIYMANGVHHIMNMQLRTVGVDGSADLKILKPLIPFHKLLSDLQRLLRG